MGSFERLSAGVMRNWFHASSKREFKANVTRDYEGHYEGVRSAVVGVSSGGGRRRLLEYELGSGWGRYIRL